jgi:hypothetical protein
MVGVMVHEMRKLRCPVHKIKYDWESNGDGMIYERTCVACERDRRDRVQKRKLTKREIGHEGRTK